MIIPTEYITITAIIGAIYLIGMFIRDYHTDYCEWKRETRAILRSKSGV